MTQKNKTEQESKKFRESKVLKLFQELNNAEQRNIYGLIWSLTAKDLLYRIEKDKSKETNK